MSDSKHIKIELALLAKAAENALNAYGKVPDETLCKIIAQICYAYAQVHNDLSKEARAINGSRRISDVMATRID